MFNVLLDSDALDALCAKASTSFQLRFEEKINTKLGGQGKPCADFLTWFQSGNLL